MSLETAKNIDVNQWVQILSTEEAAAFGGFTIGMMSIIDEQSITKKPLSVLFAGSLYGAFCAFGAGVVSSVLPNTFKPLVPLFGGLFFMRVVKDKIFDKK